jgi:hypothetical protein
MKPNSLIRNGDRAPRQFVPPASQSSAANRKTFNVAAQRDFRGQSRFECQECPATAGKLDISLRR